MKANFTLFILIFLQSVASAQFWTGPFVFETVDFETPYFYLVLDTSQNNVWEIAPPQKPILNQAYSPTHVIITDSISPYPANTNSHFDIYLTQENASYYPDAIFMKFKHRICSDTIKDGGFITYSCDLGATWLNVISPDACYYWDVFPGDLYFNDAEYRNLYTASDTLFNGEPGFSGCMEDWEEVILDWHYLPIRPARVELADTMIVRFNFISDSIDSPYDGWMIDDIEFFTADIGSSVNDRERAQFEVFPNPTNDFLAVQLESYTTNFTARIFSSMGAKVFSSIQNSGDNLRIRVKDLPEGLYFLSLDTDLERLGTQKFLVQH